MIDLLPDNIRALLHLSEISHTMSHPDRLGLKVGDEVKVKYLGRDEVTDRIQVSRKVLLDPPVRPSRSSKDEQQIHTVRFPNHMHYMRYRTMIR